MKTGGINIEKRISTEGNEENEEEDFRATFFVTFVSFCLKSDFKIHGVARTSLKLAT